MLPRRTRVFALPSRARRRLGSEARQVRVSGDRKTSTGDRGHELGPNPDRRLLRRSRDPRPFVFGRPRARTSANAQGRRERPVSATARPAKDCACAKGHERSLSSSELEQHNGAYVASARRRPIGRRWPRAREPGAARRPPVALMSAPSPLPLPPGAATGRPRFDASARFVTLSKSRPAARLRSIQRVKASVAVGHSCPRPNARTGRER